MTMQYEQNSINLSSTSFPLIVAADGAVEISNTTGGIQIADSTVGNKTITTASSFPGQKLEIVLLAWTAGEYRLPLNSGVLTFAASGSAVVQRNADNTQWVAIGLSGATIV